MRVQLPPGFEAKPGERWPVLYLLHGAGGDHAQLTQFAADSTLSAADVLVVMPDGGITGFYSDWWNGGGGGPPMWETFHLVELRELLERNWRAGDRRAVAGVSMGGYGAIEYAARQPGYFLAAASYSGPVAPFSDPEAFIQVLAGIGAAGSDDLWGDPVAQAEVWRAHDPAVNASQLSGTDLFVSFGSGEPGPLDGSDASFDELEAFAATQGRAFVDRLTELQIPATVDAYGPGTHDGTYFLREFERSLPSLLEALAE